MQLKQITFALENCDSITVEGKHVGAFDVINMREEIRRIACNAIAHITIADCILEIHKNANQIHHEFGIDNHTCPVFDRLSVGDIVSIELEFVSDVNAEHVEHYQFYTEWEGEGDENLYQKSYVSDLGNLYIVISGKDDIPDVFNMNDINDADVMNLHFELMEVG